MRTQSKETQHGLGAARALANLKERNEPFVNDVKTIRTSRREFVRLSALAVGCGRPGPLVERACHRPAGIGS